MLVSPALINKGPAENNSEPAEMHDSLHKATNVVGTSRTGRAAPSTRPSMLWEISRTWRALMLAAREQTPVTS